MSFFTLFSGSRKPEVLQSLQKPDEILQQSLRFEGGVLRVRGGIQVDAQLENVSIIAEDGGPVHITALGVVKGCHIQAKDVVIAGKFSGELEADGDVEVTSTAQVAGHIKTSGSVLISPLADDAEVRIGRLTPKVQRVDDDHVGHGSDVVDAQAHAD